MRIAGIIKTSSVDGQGMRFTVFTQGCRHNCVGCHNVETHDFRGGQEVHIEKIVQQYKENAKFLKGITLSGGDPMEQAKECIELINELRETLDKYGGDIWLYTGYTFEEIMASENSDMIKLLEMIDILVDSKFEIENKVQGLRFKGSSNQRLIDVRATLLNNTLVCVDM